MKSEVNLSGESFILTRVFDAPRPDVFGWWAEAEKLQQWSGCKEATDCEVVMDFRVGGSFTQKMQISVQGGKCEFSFVGSYEEIIVPERISYRTDLGRGATMVTIDFFDLGGQTKVVLKQDGLSDAASCGIVFQGTQESFDKLYSILAAQPAPETNLKRSGIAGAI
jgi:uncharacterized protein YndB with AHSA1/START domain